METLTVWAFGKFLGIKRGILQRPPTFCYFAAEITTWALITGARNCMSLPDHPKLNFESHLSDITSADCLQHQPSMADDCSDAFEAALAALSCPIDFPPMTAAIVPGDTVAIAVDPNTPQVSSILSAALQLVQKSDAASVSVVVGDEASSCTLKKIKAVVGDAAQVELHQPSDRESLRFLGPDALANPMYLNRLLVDADFVLPITSGRCGDLDRQYDLHGFFPAFSDSASRLRLFSPPQDTGPEIADPNEPALLLGAQLILCVSVSTTGEAADVIAGTASSIRKRLQETRQVSPKQAATPLVVASLDGDQQQQTWQNTARAAAAAARHSDPGSTIVLWTNLSDSPSGALLSIADENVELPPFSEPLSEDEFPFWDPTLAPADTLRRLVQEYRIILRSELNPEATESLGIGTIQSAAELSKLTDSFASCIVLRAASFCGSTYDWQEPT